MNGLGTRLNQCGSDSNIQVFNAEKHYRLGLTINCVVVENIFLAVTLLAAFHYYHNNHYDDNHKQNCSTNSCGHCYGNCTITIT